MKISIIGSTCHTREDSMLFAGHAAGVCYMPDSYEALMQESQERTMKRAKTTLESGHHSVYDHLVYSLLIEDIPKILAMVLNNEEFYTTSEKSARYTQMSLSGDERSKYDKWKTIFFYEIKVRYGERFLKFYETIPKAEKQIEKLAMENARYMTGLFTPTTMIYSTTLRQINYILAFFKHFANEERLDMFGATLAWNMLQFCAEIPNEVIVPGLDADLKGRRISLFSELSDVEEHFGETYCTKYWGSWAQLAQAQRHRTLSYSVFLPLEKKPYIPEIIKYNPDMVEDWKRDMLSLSMFYPQGFMVRICERGTYENFILKCYERICGNAQLEIAIQTKRTLEKYHEARPDLVGDEFMRGSRCSFPNFKCNKPCVWHGGERDI